MRQILCSLVPVVFVILVFDLCEGFHTSAEVQALNARQVEIPTVNNFRRRAHQSITVLGNYLYINGGELAQFVNGKPDIQEVRPLNITQSIPLDQKWTNSTLSIKSIKRIAPNGKNSALWADHKSNSVYSWGGDAPYPDTIAKGADNKNLWAFTPDGKGGGSWASRAANNPAVFLGIRRGAYGISASCNGVGFVLGGRANPYTDSSLRSEISMPGLIMYNMGSGNWENRTATGNYETAMAGEAMCLPFGPNGLVMFLGGAFSSLTDPYQLSPINFNNVTFYDPVANIWYSQTTTGSQPDQRQYFCSTGVAGPNGTFEIYIYGGFVNTATPSVVSDIWVLSLPAFRWFKSPVDGDRRYQHSCALVGNRQMIVVGGKGFEATWFPPNGPPTDPWAQGLGILDLPSLSWRDHYDPNAGPYDSPDMVKEFYNKGGMAQMLWTDEKVKALFMNESTPQTPQSPTSPPSPKNKGPPTKAIIGGVIGGLASLVLAMGLGAFFYRRWKLSRSKDSLAALGQAHEKQNMLFEQKPELDSSQRFYGYELPQETTLVEVRVDEPQLRIHELNS